MSTYQPTTIDKINTKTNLKQFVSSGNIELLWSIIITNKAFSSQLNTVENKTKLRAYYITKTKEFIEKNIATQ